MNRFDFSGPLTGQDIPAEAAAQDTFVFPPSFAQQRLWFFDQWEPNSSVYNIPAAFRLTGLLNVAALEKSLNEIVWRHESLRTTFAVEEGQPIQVIAPALAVTPGVVDLRGLGKIEREAEARHLAAKEAQRLFDLARGPLVRLTLLRLDEDEHVLLLIMHHVISDGWSMGVFFRELSVLYEAFSAGKASPLPELSIQYADFAVWQREWLQGEVLQDQLSYWRKQLNGAPSAINLPADKPRPALQSYRGEIQSFELPREITDRLKAVCRKEGVTLFMALLAVFQALLYRYTGQDDIAIGSPIANRNRAEIEGLIGFFVNTLVLRADLSGNPSFQELLQRVREIALAAYAHQDLPFEKLVEELQPERDLSRNPLFQVMFVLQNTPMSTLQLPGLVVKRLPIDRVTTKFDLTLTAIEEAGELRGLLSYNTDLFDGATITRMLGHFQTLLEGIVTDPEQRLLDLSMLTEAERRQLLFEWNDTRRDYPKANCIHQLFEAQVEETPDATAVMFENKQLTYRELNRRANQLARQLRASGVGPDVLVGICVQRSLEMIVGLLGILKAGGAYVPLDPTYPKARLAFMLEDTQARVVLTQKNLLGAVEEIIDIEKSTLKIQNRNPVLSEVEGSKIENPTVLCLDTDSKIITQESEENPVSGVTAENLAYVIYTSGSTGRPKGVLIEHEQILNYVRGIWDYCDLRAGAAFALVQPLCADSSQTVIIPSLISGGCLHVISEEKVADPEALREYFLCHPIDLLKIAPSHLAAVQTSSHPEQVLPHRWLVIGGESFSREWVEKLQSMAPNCIIFNHYGPTEATVGMLTYRVPKEQPGHSSSTVPIGRPLPNSQAYLLDRHLKPVPIGVPGELHIGGRCLARGYLNRSELTAQKFIPNPFSDEPGARLYKSGDLARYLPDGNIEFLGRTDDQIKMRGFRIEPGEVEAALADHPGVRQSLVLVRKDEPNENRLVAYVVLKPEALLTTGDLRKFLEQKLPNYMVPSVFVLLNALPRTPHGKVDRQALPAPDRSRPGLNEAMIAPRTPAEKVIADIWAEVLKLEKVGIYENFFDLGGHSLLVTQVISRLRSAFQVELPLRALFQNPTVAGLAVKIAQAEAKRVAPEKVADLLDDLESLSDEEADRLLVQENPEET